MDKEAWLLLLILVFSSRKCFIWRMIKKKRPEARDMCIDIGLIVIQLLDEIVLSY